MKAAGESGANLQGPMVVTLAQGAEEGDGWLRESDSQDRLKRFQQQTWQVALIDWIDGVGGEGEREGGSASQFPGWLNWLAERSAYCVLGPLLTTSLSLLIFKVHEQTGSG